MLLRRKAAGLALAIGLLTSGCATRRQTKLALFGVEAGIAAVGVVSIARSGPEDDGGYALLGFGLIAIAASAALITTIGFWASESASAPHPAITRDHAFQLTKQAAEAAREGDCTIAHVVDSTVRDLDDDFHERVFARHSAIARCLAMPPPSLPPDPAMARAATRERASELTKHAARAARVGQCKIVVQLGATVKTLDAEFHAATFVNDAEIARCLTALAPR